MIDKKLEIEERNVFLSFEKAEVTASDDGYRFKGYASVFNGKDYYGDTILPGAFSKTIAKETPKMFFNHQTNEVPIGKWETVKEDDKGLYVEALLTKGIKTADEVALAVKAKTLDGMSVGFTVKSDGIEYNEETGGYIIKEVYRLREISVVTFPADNAARIEKAEGLKTFKDIERHLRDAGLSSTEAKTVISKTKAAAFEEFQRDAEIKKHVNELSSAIKRITNSLKDKQNG